VELVNQDTRIYLPNQMVRGQGHPCLREIWFCARCMRAVEDALRATINYRIRESRQENVPENEE
jgi:hypothetical protein